MSASLIRAVDSNPQLRTLFVMIMLCPFQKNSPASNSCRAILS
jgi:hypothetical protein